MARRANCLWMAVVTAGIVNKTQRGTAISRQPVVAEAEQGEHDGIKINAALGHAIFCSAAVADRGASKNFGPHQTGKPVGQGRSRDLEGFLDLFEPLRAKIDLAQDQECPRVCNHRQGSLD